MVRAPQDSSTEPLINPRDAAIWALTRIEKDSAYLDRLISELHRRAGKDPRDQNLAEAIVKGVLENQVALENLLRPFVEKFDRSAPELRAALFVGAAQLKVLSAIPAHAAVSETVNAARRILGSTRAGLVNAVLRRVSESTIPLERLSGLPAWVNHRFTSQYGEESAQLLEALDTPLPIFVRVNPMRGSITSCIAAFAEVGVTATVFEALNQMLSLDLNGARIPDAIFAKGICTVQDPSAALVGLAVDPREGERILDLCAAPGGKTTHIAELMRNTGTVLACDINEKRLALVKQHAERLGLTNVVVQQRDATLKLDSSSAKAAQRFDRVLLDAPCSGTGVFSKKRDALVRKREEDLKRLVETQRALLAGAVRDVKPAGGLLVYSTCSLDVAENEEQVAWFLEAYPEFKLMTEHARVPASFVAEDGAEHVGPVDAGLMKAGLIKALPHRHGCAGGFAAVFRRK